MSPRFRVRFGIDEVERLAPQLTGTVKKYASGNALLVTSSADMGAWRDEIRLDEARQVPESAYTRLEGGLGTPESGLIRLAGWKRIAETASEGIQAALGALP